MTIGSKKLYILLVDDWELKGNGLGSVQELQYETASFLMDLCEKINIKMTFMVDVAQQLIFNTYLNYPEIKEQKELWDDTVKSMYIRGFDVQLHLHPQWIDAKYEDGFFYVGENWNISTYPPAAGKHLIKNSVEYLEELIRQDCPEYKVNSFKPGSWAMQPSEGVVQNLLDVGIKLTIGIKKGLYIPNQKIDYRLIEEDTFPYYADEKDITKVSQNQNGMLVMPLAYYSPNLLNKLSLLYDLCKNKIVKNIKKSNSKKYIPSKIKNLRPFIGYQLTNLFKPYLTHLKIGNQSYGYMKNSFDAVFNRLSKLDENNIPIIIESHTKDFIDNYNDIEKFLKYVVGNYRENVEFINLTEFLHGVEENRFNIKIKE